MSRIVFYQLFVRYFSNLTNECKPHGSIEENGCGKFNHITSAVLSKLKDMGITHLYLTGVIEHSSATSYPGLAADSSQILKGRAGSPFAVRDYFDVAADLAENVTERLMEFQSLVQRCHETGFKVIIDFIPNHVSRAYKSDIRPELDFGLDDDTSSWFSPNNNFYYLEGNGPLTLPTGIYEPEKKVGKVSGNNANRWNLNENDWYETVKLNYGYDFIKGIQHVSEDSPSDTWCKMDQVIEYWQNLGVDGFRCDMAHMVPVEFWQWLIKKANARKNDVYFMAEAYDGDPMKATSANVLTELLDVGFSTAYDSEAYDLVKGIFEEGKWANDLEQLIWDEQKLHQLIKYVENHDEVRTASPQHWGVGESSGFIAIAVLALMTKAPIMIFNGQESAEAALGSEGFGGDDGRTTIFDYWTMQQHRKAFSYLYGERNFINMKESEYSVVKKYKKLFKDIQSEDFVCGELYCLNYLNQDNLQFGRIEGEECSGRWVCSFIRFSKRGATLVVINLHPYLDMKNVVVKYPFLLSGGRKKGENIVKIKNIASSDYVFIKK